VVALADTMAARMLWVGALAVAHARRQLQLVDAEYGLEAFHRTHDTRARSLFGTSEAAADQAFTRRLHEHESSLADDDLQTYIVTLQEGYRPCDALKLTLEAWMGGHPVDSVVGDDFLVHATAGQADALRDAAEVRKVVPYLPELKVAPYFDQALPEGTNVSLLLNLIPFAQHEAVRPPVEQLISSMTKTMHKACTAGELRAPSSCDTLKLRAEAERIVVATGVARAEALQVAEALAAIPEVQWVEPVPYFYLMNDEGNLLIQSGSNPLGGGIGSQPLGQAPIWDMGIHGEGEIIGVGDSGLDTGHCFFEQAPGQTANDQTYSPNARKVVAYRPYADGGATGQADHGTHVTGSILGKASAPNGADADKGVAYEAKVSFTDIGLGDSAGLSVPANLATNFYNVDYDNGARIHSNSWGSNTNAYTTYAAQTDLFTLDNPDMLVLVAAGNSGQNGPGSVGSPATAKNCLAVGASENSAPAQGRADGNMAFFSSQGPTGDGRRKPDVAAPGYFVTSANSNSGTECSLTEMAGTSMATPITAGAAALVRQYLKEGFYPTGLKGGSGGIQPSAALVKAMLIGGAVDMKGTYQDAPLSAVPSQVQGYGRIQLDRVLFGAEADGTNAGDRLFLLDDATNPIGNGDEHVYTIPAGGVDTILGGEFKVTLVWTDPPANPGSANALINDLNLVVDLGDGQTLLGNGGPDSTNNVEQVVADVSGATLNRIVYVRGAAVRQGTQAYSLVVTGPLALTSPPPESPRGLRRPLSRRVGAQSVALVGALRVGSGLEAFGSAGVCGLSRSTETTTGDFELLEAVATSPMAEPERWRMQCWTAACTDAWIHASPTLLCRPARLKVSSTRVPRVLKASRMPRSFRSRCKSSSMCRAVESMDATGVISMTM